MLLTSFGNDRKVNYKTMVYWQLFRLVNLMPHAVYISLPELAAQAEFYSETEGNLKGIKRNKTPGRCLVFNQIFTGNVIRFANF